MESWLIATLPLVLAILRLTIKNPKSRAKLKDAVFAVYVAILAFYPEFAEQPVTAAKKKQILAGLPTVH